MAEVWAQTAEGGGGGRARLGGGTNGRGRGRTVQRRARTVGGAHGSRKWGLGGGFASSSFLLASSLHDWLTFGFSIKEIS
jgi:hypothetical protein